MKKTLVIMPAYNEEKNIARIIQDIKAVNASLDILAINDGSSDATSITAKESGAMVLDHPFNMGYGVALQTGYKYAWGNGYEYVVQMDADGQHDPASIPALLAPVFSGEVDIAMGSRFLGTSYRPPLVRRAGMALFCWIVRLITGMFVTDTTSGYQAFNRDVICFFLTDIFPVDYPDADMLIMLHRANFRMKEVPVRMFESRDGKSMHGGLKPIYYIFKMLLSIGVTLMRAKGKTVGCSAGAQYKHREKWGSHA